MVNWYKMSVYYSLFMYICTSEVQKGQGYMNERIVWRRNKKENDGKYVNDLSFFIIFFNFYFGKVKKN